MSDVVKTQIDLDQERQPYVIAEVEIGGLIFRRYCGGLLQIVPHVGDAFLSVREARILLEFLSRPIRRNHDTT